MATPAAVLSILVNADTAAAQSGLAKTEAQLVGTSKAAGATTSASAKAGAALKKMGTIAKYGAAAGAAAFIYEAKKSVQTTNDLTKSTLLLTKNFGLSGKAASEWAGVAQARGADATKLGMAFKTLASQISGAADGSETSIKMFRALGFTQKDIQRSMTDTQFAVGKVAAGFEDLPPGMQKADLAGKLFGRGWQTIFPILRDGRAAMQEQLDTVEKYGGVIAGKTLKQQEEFLAAQRESKIAWQGMQVTLATALTPALETVNEQFQRIARIMASDKLTSDQKFSKVADLLSKDFNRALDLVIDHLDEIASRAGQAGVKIAGGLVKGFMGADVWGKLLIGGWLISKMGGLGAVTAAGRTIGTRLGGSIAASTAAETGGLNMILGAGGIGAGALIAQTAGVAGGVAALGYAIRQATGDGGHLKDQMAALGDALGAVKSDAKRLSPAIAQTITDFHMQGEVIGKLKDQYGTFSNAAHFLSRTQKNAWMTIATEAERNGDITIGQLTKLSKAFGSSGKRWEREMQAAARVTGQTTKQISNSVGDSAVSVSKTYDGMVKVVGGGLNWLTSNTSKAAQALGSTKEVKFHTSPAATGPGHFGHRMNRGGDVPGVGNTDTVPAMLTPGEFVVRKDQAAKHRQLLEAINFQKYAKGGVIEQALGPYTIPPIMYDPNHAGSNSHVHADFFTVAQALAYGHKAQGMGWSIGEYTPKQGNPFGFGPITTQHQSPGHYDGTAWDANQGIVESRSAVAALAKLFNSGVAGAAVEKIARLILHGPTGSMRLRETGQTALDKVWHEANKYLTKLSPKFTTTGKDFPGGQFSKPELVSLWKATNRGLGDPNLMAAIALAESGGNPNALNPSGASGLWQILGQLVPGNIFDPVVNAKNAAAKLRTQGLGAWVAYTSGAYQQFMQKGGMVMPPYAGSFGNGGVVPGPIGAPRSIVAHGGERVGQPNLIVDIHTHFAPGMEWLEDLMDHRIEISEGESRTHTETMNSMGG